MKFSLFAHMERLTPEQPHAELYDEFIALAGIADRGGMHALWTGEHHGMDFTIAPNPFINLADLARRTTNLRLGTGTVVAPFWHPIKLAGEAAMCDIVSGGRLDLGIARGAYAYEYQRIGGGIEAAEAGRRLRAMIPAIKGLWEGDHAVDNEFWSFPATTSAPKPLQQPHPPIWIAARDPSSHDFAVAQGCNVQVTPLSMDDAEVESLMQRFEAACASHPETPRPKIMLLRHTFVGATEAEVVRGAEDVSRFYCHFATWFKNERPVSQGLIEPLSEPEMAAMEMFSPARMRANNVIGTPGEVVARLKRYEALGYDEYAFWIDTGMAFERKKRSLELFIERVMPEFG